MEVDGPWSETMRRVKLKISISRVGTQHYIIVYLLQLRWQHSNATCGSNQSTLQHHLYILVANSIMGDVSTHSYCMPSMTPDFNGKLCTGPIRANRMQYKSSGHLQYHSGSDVGTNNHPCLDFWLQWTTQCPPS